MGIYPTVYKRIEILYTYIFNECFVGTNNYGLNAFVKAHNGTKFFDQFCFEFYVALIFYFKKISDYWKRFNCRDIDIFKISFS